MLVGNPEYEPDDDTVEVVRGFVDDTLIADVPELHASGDEEFSICRLADGTFSLIACVPNKFPTIVVRAVAAAHVGFRSAAHDGDNGDDGSDDGDGPALEQAVAAGASSLMSPPSRNLTAAQAKAARMAELVLACPTRAIAKRLVDMDYSLQLLKLVPLAELLGEFDPPLCTNAGQRHSLAALCKVGAMTAPLVASAPPPGTPPPPTMSAVRRTTCGHVSRRSAASAASAATPAAATAELHARHSAGEFGLDSDDDDASDGGPAPPRGAAAPAPALGSALFSLSATVNENHCLSALLRQVAPAELPLALRAIFTLVKPGVAYDRELAPFLIEGMLQHLTAGTGGVNGDLHRLRASGGGVGPAVAHCQMIVAAAATAAASATNGTSLSNQSHGGTSSGELSALGELIVSSGSSKGDEKEKASLERGRIKALVAQGAASPAVRAAFSDLHAAVRTTATTKHELLAKVRGHELGAEGELISELLHSAHVYTVNGMLTSPDDRALVTTLRVVLEGVDRALGGLMKRLLPTGADSVKMATCLRTGQMRSINASEVSYPLLKQGWLSVDGGADAKSKAKTGAKAAPSLQRMWSAIEYGLVTSHGRDTTMHYALTEAYMHAVLADSVSGVAELVLGNIMGEYEDAWTSCHRGSSPCPTMREVLDLPEIHEQMMCVAQARLQSEQGVAAATAGDGQLAALRAEMTAIAAKLQASQTTVSRLVAASPTVKEAATSNRNTRRQKAAAAAAAAAATAATAAAAAAAKASSEAAKAPAK